MVGTWGAAGVSGEYTRGGHIGGVGATGARGSTGVAAGTSAGTTGSATGAAAACVTRARSSPSSSESPRSSPSISSMRIRTSIEPPITSSCRCRGRARPQFHGEVAVECFGEPEQGVDAGWPAAVLEAGDCALRGRAEPRELDLREAEGEPAFRHLRGNRGEQPAIVCMGEPAAEPVERLGRGALLASFCFVLISYLRYTTFEIYYKVQSDIRRLLQLPADAAATGTHVSRLVVRDDRRRSRRPPPHLQDDDRDVPAWVCRGGGRPRDQLCDRGGRAVRPPRSERCGQDDDDQDADHAPDPDLGNRARARARCRQGREVGSAAHRLRVRRRPWALRAALRPRQPALLRRALRRRSRRCSGRGSTSCSSSSASAAARRSVSKATPAGCGSGSTSPAASCTTHPSSSSTSRRSASTRSAPGSFAR